MRRAVQGLLAAAIVLAVLCGVIGVVFQRRSDDAARAATARTQAAATGKEVVAQLFSYDYQTIDGVQGVRLPLLTEAFGKQYRSMIREKVAPAAKSQKLVTRTDVVSTSVMSARADAVRLLMFLNQTTAEGTSQVPVLAGSRVSVLMEKVGGSWRVASVDPV